VYESLNATTLYFTTVVEGVHASVTGALNITGLLHANIIAVSPSTLYGLWKKIGLVDEYFDTWNLKSNFNECKITVV